MVSLLVHVVVASVQVQPVPLIDVAVIPDGSVATRVAVPLVAPRPLFDTVMVN